jgi:nicotinate-nucleotide adenylyltransferase
MAIANYLVSFSDLDEVWMVVSPQNPLKNKNQLLDQNQRLALVNIAIGDFSSIKSSNIEFSLTQPSYTINTLAYLTEKYPHHQFALIMGQDNLQNFHKWKNYEEILSSFNIYVYPRMNAIASKFDHHPKVHFTTAPLIEVSSTFIRQAIKEKKDVRFLLTEKVWEEIQAAHLYQ